jgi:hypothetical protein
MGSCEIRSGYSDLGGDFFDRLEPEHLTRYYVNAWNASATR